MRGTELLRLVWLNLKQNKFKTIMTSIGIIVGAATIVMVIGIGRGGQIEVAEQFASLNAGAIDISYEYEGAESGGFSFDGFSMGGISQMFGFGGGMPGGMSFGRGGMSFGGSGGGPMSFGGGMPGGMNFGGDSGSGSGRGSSQGGFSGMPGGGSMPDFSGSEMPDFGGEMPDFSSGEMPEGFEDFAGEMPEGFEDFMPGNGAEGQENETDMEGESESGTADTEVIEEEAEPETVSDEDSITAERLNQENIILSADDVRDIELFVTGITGATISYSTRSSIEGGNLTDAETYTVAGVIDNYASLSNLVLAEGEFITEDDNDRKSRICVLGAAVAKELFGNALNAYESTIYIDDRAYTIGGVLATSSTVSAGISPDDAIFIPYETGIKYITGESIDPTITVIAEEVNTLDSVIANLKVVLAENYNTAEFTFANAGSKMEAAESSNQILTLLLAAMAVIVFIVGGIGIMNVLFVAVKERTGEIGILKSLGASRSTILLEFLLESAAISLLGGVLGVGVSFVVTPIVEHYSIRVEANVFAWAAALGFAVLTGTLFGFYPAWKASKLIPVEALNAE